MVWIWDDGQKNALQYDPSAKLMSSYKAELNFWKPKGGRVLFQVGIRGVECVLDELKYSSYVQR